MTELTVSFAILIFILLKTKKIKLADFRKNNLIS